MTIDDNIYNLRVKGKIKNIDDLNSVVIKYNENSPVYLRNIAAVNDTFKDKKQNLLLVLARNPQKIQFLSNCSRKLVEIF